jgi:hypothetical protein
MSMSSKNLPPPRPAEAPGPRFGDVKVAAAPFTVSWRTFLRWADRGLVPWGVKIGGRRLWDLDELDRFIRGGCKPVRKGGRTQ